MDHPTIMDVLQAELTKTSSDVLRPLNTYPCAGQKSRRKPSTLYSNRRPVGI